MTSITAPTNDVTANAYYSTDNGSTYTAGATGGTVKAGSAEAGATSTSSVKYKSTVSLVATATSGYHFDGWYDAASGGTKVSGNSTYTYTLSTTGAKNVYARFIREEWTLKYGASSGSNWSSVNMTVSGNNVTGTMTLTEGQEFSFKLNKRIGNAETWYGANNASYSNITSTSFISNLSLNTSDGDIHMKGHAGTYTLKVSDVESKMHHKAGFMKWLFDFFFSPFGLIVFIFLLLLVFFDEILNIIHITSGKYDENEQEESIGEIIKRIQQEDKEKEEQMMTAGDDENETK